MQSPYRLFATAVLVMILANGFTTSFSVASEPEIAFDKQVYRPFDEVVAAMNYQKGNSDPDKKDTLTANVFSSSMARMQTPAHKIVFTEIAENRGIFASSVGLTPDPNLWSGDIVVQRDDDLIVEFNTSDQKFSARVDVDFYSSSVMLAEPAYKVTDMAKIIVIDVDKNMRPDTIDTLDVRVWSTTDRGGLLVTLRETGDRTGLFAEFLTFTLDEESTGTRLRVSEGDTITVKYTDNSLPAPAALSSNKFETVEVEELFASASIGYLVPPIERAVASEPQIVDSRGESVESVSASEQVLIQSEITNNQNKKQPFAYIVQIKDDEGVTVSLSWVTGELPPEDSFKAAQSWVPDAQGMFSIEVFVWESIDSPNAISPVRSTTVDIL
jgi:hypothetical protein